MRRAATVIKRLNAKRGEVNNMAKGPINPYKALVAIAQKAVTTVDDANRGNCPVRTVRSKDAAEAFRVAGQDYLKAHFGL